MKNLEPNTKEYYINLLSFVLGTSLLSLLLLIKFWHNFSINPKLLALLFIPFSIGILGLAIPTIIIHLLKGIQFVQHKIGLLITFIILSVVFYLLLTPLALLSRLFSKKKTVKENSNFIDRNYTFEKNDFKKTF